MAAFGGFLGEIFLSHPVKDNKRMFSLLSFFCSNSLCLFFPLPSSPPLAFVTSPFSLALLSFFCSMSFFSPLLSSHLPPLIFASSLLLSHSPFIKFYGNLKEDKHVKFPQSQPHSFSSSQSPAASAATSNHIPLFTFTLSFPPPVSVPHLIFPSSLQTVSHVSQIPVYVPHHATPCLSPPLLFFSACVTPFHTLWLLIIPALSDCHSA